MTDKIVKCKKKHTCSFCGRTIQKGEKALFMKLKTPRYEVEMTGNISIDRQVGIEYHNLWYCYSEENEEIPGCKTD